MHVMFLHQQQALPSAPSDLGDKCSSGNLQTAAGISACRAACAPASCCQTDIGSANCGYAACGSYGGCNALVSVMSVDVSRGGDAGDEGDGGDGSDGSDGSDGVDREDRNPLENEGDAVSAEDGEITAIAVDTSYTDTATVDVTFDVPEDGSLLDAVENAKEDQNDGDGKVWEDTALVDRADAAADDAAGKKGKKEKKSKGSSGGAADLKAKKKGKTKGSTAASLAEANATTDQSPFSTGQIVGIAVGGFVALCVLIRIIKWCCCRKKVD